MKGCPGFDCGNTGPYCGLPLRKGRFFCEKHEADRLAFLDAQFAILRKALTASCEHPPSRRPLDAPPGP